MPRVALSPAISKIVEMPSVAPFALARIGLCFAILWSPIASVSVRVGSHSVLLRHLWFPFGSVSTRFVSQSVLLRSPFVSILFGFGSLWFALGSASPLFGFRSVLFQFALFRIRFCFTSLRSPFGSVWVRFGSHSVLLRPPTPLGVHSFSARLGSHSVRPRPLEFPFGSVSVRFGSRSVLVRLPLVSNRFCLGSLWVAFGSASVPFWFGSVPFQVSSHSVLLHLPGFHSVLFWCALVCIPISFAPLWFPFGSLSFRVGSHSVLLRPAFGFHSVLLRLLLVSIRASILFFSSATVHVGFHSRRDKKSNVFPTNLFLDLAISANTYSSLNGHRLRSIKTGPCEIRTKNVGLFYDFHKNVFFL